MDKPNIPALSDAQDLLDALSTDNEDDVADIRSHNPGLASALEYLLHVREWHANQDYRTKG